MSMEDSPMNPVVPPRPEVTYVGVTTRPPISSRSPTGSNVSHAAERETRRRDPPPVPPRDMSLGRESVGGDWEAREDMWNKEMEEVSANIRECCISAPFCRPWNALLFKEDQFHVIFGTEKHWISAVLCAISYKLTQILQIPCYAGTPNT